MAKALKSTVSIGQFIASLRWLDGSPLRVLPYRRGIFDDFNARDAAGVPRFNLGLFGRGKKNDKTLDSMIEAAYCVFDESPQGSQVYVVANDEDQASDDLDLLKKLFRANPPLAELVSIQKRTIERKDGRGFIEVLPARDAVGAHGKTYRLLLVDEIHGYTNWDLLEALAPDPTRLDAQQWITSYASLYHKPGVPLYDLMQTGKAGTDSRMLFSWYSANLCTDPDVAEKTPEERANPSMESWGNPGYLEQQKRRLPSHKYRRLHLNLPGLPEGSAYQPEPIADAITRGVSVRPPQLGVRYAGSVDMSGGSDDDACCSIAHYDPTTGQIVVDVVMHQGQRPPFDPRAAVDRFARVLAEYGVTRVTGDRYAGNTFRSDFARHNITYVPSRLTTSEHYEWLEPILNGRRVQLPDTPMLEQQLLGLVWRGSKITHPPGEHDDWTAACSGAVHAADPNAKHQAMAVWTKADAEAHSFRAHLKACAEADAARERAGEQDAFLWQQLAPTPRDWRDEYFKNSGRRSRALSSRRVIGRTRFP
jgi:hypothetical protein